MKNRLLPSLLAFSSFLAPLGTLAQTPAPRPAFDVVSLKPNPPGIRGSMTNLSPGGRLLGNNVSLKRLIEIAYQVQPDQIEGTMNWLDSQGYEMEARAGKDVPWDQMMLMLQSLLEERFKLKFHHETRQLPIYNLTLAKSGVEGGPNMRANPYDECVAKDTPQLEDQLHVFPAPPPGAQSTATANACGGIIMNGSQIYGRGLPIQALVEGLSMAVQRSVVDKTGLKGEYNVMLRWLDLPPGLDPPPGKELPATLSIFTAVSEQLGLKLESAKGPIDVIVIDSAEKASEN